MNREERAKLAKELLLGKCCATCARYAISSMRHRTHDPTKLNCEDKWTGEKKWQDESRTWTTVDEVYETRWDCSIEPEGVRQSVRR